MLHTVKYNGEIAGVIIYECKRTPKIENSHVQQTCRAKQARGADFAILVTTGTKSGFGGLAKAKMDGVFVVSHLGVLALAFALREGLVEIRRAGTNKEKQAKIGKQLVDFIESPDFTNRIEEVVSIAEDLENEMKKEMKSHAIGWNRRHAAHGRIKWDGSDIQRNLRLVLDGGKQRRLDQPKLPLLLPASVTSGT